MNKEYLKKSLVILLVFTAQLAFSQKVIPKKENEKPKAAEPNAVTDQVFADDLIVQGSACIGIDCVNGESFGFETVRIKENNTRIRFVDTSNSASFPNVDWELEANSGSNGGLNSFTVISVDSATVRRPFSIESGARNDALYVESNGHIGIGTDNPVVNLHVKEGNTATLRLEQDASSGFTPQIWDMAGNETNFFIRDVNNSSALPFRVKSGAATDALVIDSDNNIGLGVLNAMEPLHIKDDNPNILLDGDSHDWLFDIVEDTLRIKLDGETTLAINSTNMYMKGAILPMASMPSDRRLKNGISTFFNAQRTIGLLSPKTFRYDLTAFPDYGFPKGTQYGLIAQEVEKVLPQYVNEVSFPDGKRFKTVNYIGLIPILLQSNKEQQAEIEQLKKKISTYEALESRLTALEAKLEENEINEPLKTDK